MEIPFSHDLLRFIDQHQYLALFLFILVEESGLPLPVPGDGIMAFAGYRVLIGRLAFIPAFLTMEVATLIGASLLHWIGRRGGRPMLRRYGRFIHLNEDRFKFVEQWYARHGVLSILLGRLIPGLRIASSFSSGVFEVPYPIFLPYITLGSSLYIIFFMLIGMGLGRGTRRLIRLLWPHPIGFLVAAIIIAIVVVAFLWLRRRFPKLLG